MKEIKGGVCAPKGFLAGGIRCGIKESSAKKDLALVCSPKPCTVSAMFTSNLVKAASVTVSQENCADGKLRAVIANSGNANACTGEDGLLAARKMAMLAADALSVDPCEVAVASTGVIGVPLPIGKIEGAVGELKNALRNDASGSLAALEAIMTTDTRNKEIAVEFEIDARVVRIGAITKGSGMIHPNMATMLCFITTDAAIEKDALDAALRHSVKKSFNRLTVDGDTSTNDMVLIMANGEAGNGLITNAECGMSNGQGIGISAGFNIFCEALEFVCVSLARMMARDGEGATKLVTVNVSGASSEEDAEILAGAVASSCLVKTACFGADANWGRVLCALGYGAANAGINYAPEKTDVSFAGKEGAVQVCKGGMCCPFSEEKAKRILSGEEVEILINLNEGESCAGVWGCDLSYDYVRINGDYRS